MSALEAQANQLGLQASQECERLAKDRTLTLQMLQKVRGDKFKLTVQEVTQTLSFLMEAPLKIIRVFSVMLIFWPVRFAQLACVYVPGEGETVGPGEEISQPDGGKELPQVLHCDERGERANTPPCVSCEHMNPVSTEQYSSLWYVQDTFFSVCIIKREPNN